MRTVPAPRTVAGDDAGDAGSDAGEAESRPPISALLAVGVVLAAFVALRFWTKSDLWLDEAQTVTIARFPLTKLPAALREDGSPPLYYFLLHFWMRAFGTSDLAIRSLSGVLGVACLPLSWAMGKALGGRRGAGAMLMLVATSPFAIRYSTENRMYMLIILLSLIGFFAVRSALARPTVPRLVAVAVVSGLLLLSHYWALYLIAAVSLGLAYRALREPAGPHRRARWGALVAVLAGFILFIPWVPSFLYQLHHTGTPWAPRADFTDLGNVPGDLGGLSSRLGDLLGTAYVALIVLGLFGVASGRFGVDLDLRVRRVSRPLGWVAGATLILAIGASEVGDGAYSARYLAVIFVPVLALAALGVAAIADTRVRVGVLVVLVGLGVLGSYPNITTNRTQAGVAAADIEQLGHAGDVVAYCPDQLGPAVDRLLPAGRFRQVAYPRKGNPDMVDWVDYATVNKHSQPAPFARYLVDLAGSHHDIWLVWSAVYPTFQGKCTGLLSDLVALRPQFRILFTDNANLFYEHEELVRIAPS